MVWRGSVRVFYRLNGLAMYIEERMRADVFEEQINEKVIYPTKIP